MAKRFILKSLSKSTNDATRSFERNLVNLSAIGIKWNNSLIKQMRGIGAEDSALYSDINAAMAYRDDADFRTHSNIAGQNDYIAFYDQTYQLRRDFLRIFALQGEIDYVLETIADEVIINDDMHYFAYPDTKKLKSILKADRGKYIVDEINNAYRKVYHRFHFNESNDAWHYVKKFLVDGFLAFEIIYETDVNGNASDIIGFQELDAITLQPEIRKDAKGNEYKVWIQYKDDPDKERVLLDTNVIYIAWSKNCFVSHLSYCERLIRPFNMLRTIENSRVIWNVQNAQKRVKIVVPTGAQSEQKMRTRLRELEAMYKEDIVIDNMSGEITVNGQPKFPFAKTFIFPSKDGAQTEISELEVQGHDLNSTEQLKWFWQRFMIETKLPKDRFNMFFDGQEVSAIPDNTNMTREEYKFSLFIGRIRDLFKEILLKPTWNQFCLKNKHLASSEVIKNALGLTYTEENIFTLAKEKAVLEQGVNIISQLSGLKDAENQPVFSSKFLMQKFLNLSDDDWALNKKYKEIEKEEAKQKAKENQNNAGGAMPGGDMGGEFGGGLGGDMGGGFGGDMGGALGGDFGGGEPAGGMGEMPEGGMEAGPATEAGAEAPAI